MILDVKQMRKFYKLDNIIRYNTLNKLKQETVASHSYYVSLFAMMICNGLKMGPAFLGKVLEVALTHDIPEIEINDITHDAKQKMPELVEILKKYEDEFMLCTFPAVYSTIKSPQLYDLIANQIVKVADTMSVLQYCDNEYSLGNKSFEGMVTNSYARVISEQQKLEGMLKTYAKKQ